MDLGIISPAMMKLYDDCPLKFYFKYIKNVSAPVLDKNFVVGKKIHALASYYLQKLDISEFVASLSDKEFNYFEYLKNSIYFNYEPLGIEKSISMKLDKFWIGGRIDAIVKNADDYYILDYKTGGVVDDMTYDYQTMTYFLLCDKFYSEPDSLSFVYIDLKNFKESVIKFDDKLKADYKSRLLDISENITKFNRLKFRKNCSQSCEYDKLCINY